MNDEPKATEKELTELLRQRAKPGPNTAAQTAFMAQVRNDGSFDATRTFDAVAVSLWKSHNYAVHVYEVKCSRSDWLSELKKPDKAEAAFEVADFFWVVAVKGIVKPGELPEGWGLIEAYTGKDERKLRTVTAAKCIHGNTRDSPVRRGFVVSMLRAAGAVQGAVSLDERAVNDAETRGYQQGIQAMENDVARVREQERKTRHRMQLFQNHSGILMLGSVSGTDEDLIGLAKKVRLLMTDEIAATRVKENLRRASKTLREQAAWIDRQLEEAV